MSARGQYWQSPTEAAQSRLAAQKRQELDWYASQGSRQQQQDRPLPPNWRPMYSAPRDQKIILHVPHRHFTHTPSVGVGFFDGATWQLLVDDAGPPRREPVDPGAWMPLPAFELQVQPWTHAAVVAQPSCASQLLSWLVSKSQAETITLRDIMRLAPTALRQATPAARAVESLISEGWLLRATGTARAWQVSTRLQTERLRVAGGSGEPAPTVEKPTAPVGLPAEMRPTFDRPPWLPPLPLPPLTQS